MSWDYESIHNVSFNRRPKNYSLSSFVFLMILWSNNMNTKGCRDSGVSVWVTNQWTGESQEARGVGKQQFWAGFCFQETRYHVIFQLATESSFQEDLRQKERWCNNRNTSCYRTPTEDTGSARQIIIVSLFMNTESEQRLSEAPPPRNSDLIIHNNERKDYDKQYHRQYNDIIVSK